ncbi:MAG: response regulator [Trueperaceae bacterium]
MIRVLLVDDQTLVRQGVRSLLGFADGIEVIAEAEDGAAALERIAADRPDVVLLDVRMPVVDGLEVLARLRRTADAPPVLLLTTFDDDAVALDALKLGAKGFLLKDVRLEILTDAIRTVHEGRTLVQPALTERIVRSLTDGADPDPDDGTDLAPGGLDALTERETEVLRLMVAGWTNKRIAQALELTDGTVKNHVSRILAKLGVRDRTRAVLKAIEAGLVGRGG